MKRSETRHSAIDPHRVDSKDPSGSHENPMRVGTAQEHLETIETFKLKIGKIDKQ